jgi:alpha-tubulin suppressor-like RCC1 family protein
MASAIAVSCGRHSTTVLKQDGNVVCWGSDSFGQAVRPPDLNTVVAISCCAHFVAAVTSEGRIVCWGSNEEGGCNVPKDIVAHVGYAILL